MQDRFILCVYPIHTINTEMVKRVKPLKMADLAKMGGCGVVQDARDFIGVGVGNGVVQDARNFIGVGVAGAGVVQDARNFIGVGMQHHHHHHHHHYHGEGMWDWADPNKNGLNASIQRTNAAADQALNPNKNGLSASVERTNAATDQALNPNKNGFASSVKNAFQKASKASSVATSAIQTAFSPGGSAEQFGKRVASELIHRGVPEATAYACSALAKAAFPAAGPVAGFVGSQAGKQLGTLIANKIGDATGYGLKGKPRKAGRFVKGSEEARQYMASIRAKRGGGKGLYA